jgi:hypothetical protein
MISLGVPQLPSRLISSLPSQHTVHLILPNERLFRPESACHPAPQSSFFILRIRIHFTRFHTYNTAQRTAAGSQFSQIVQILPLAPPPHQGGALHVRRRLAAWPRTDPIALYHRAPTAHIPLAHRPATRAFRSGIGQLRALS